MNVEQEPDVERRARRYAALADPTRLRIVDLLTVSDVASSELAGRLGVPSNLLAHHLKQLQAAGLIERHRSEGDGRRSYWRLVHQGLQPFGSPGLGAPRRVVFVCTANSARSHLAAATWRRESPIPADSAGTHPAARIAPGVFAAARRHHLDLPRLQPRHLDEVIAEGDLLVTVCDSAHEELAATTQLHWSVPDPVAVGTRAAFDRACDELATRVRLLAPHLDPAC